MGVTYLDTKCYTMLTNDHIVYFHYLFIVIFTIFIFIVIIYQLEIQKVQHDCQTNNNTKAMNP